jgi:hypothetical protein
MLGDKGMLPGVAEFVVLGTTVDGAEFQPPEWAEQLCGILGTPDQYSAYVRPMLISGVRSVVVRMSLELVDPKAFKTIKEYVFEHRLQVRAGRGSRDAEGVEAHPVDWQERRSSQNNKW